MNVLTYISRFLQIMKFSDFIDIAIIILLVHYLMRMVKETRARQLIKGIVIILLTLPISSLLNLTAVSYILRNTMQLGAFAVIVLFQPELRSMLEKVGRSNVGKILDFSALQNNGGKDEGVINDITEAVINMSKTKTGALIVLERETALGEYANNGTQIDSLVSASILENLFVENTPLHDGAVIIRNNRIYAAACVLPLTNNTNLSRELGTRHRAAIGLSEVSDAMVIVVSEETGKISIAINGTLTRSLDEETLKKAINKAMSPKEIKIKDKTKFWKGVFK